MLIPVERSLIAARAVTLSLLASVSVTIPKTQPAFAEYIGTDFLGFSLELNDWPIFAGGQLGKPNTFVNQLLNNLQQRTGVPPPIRVGGTSEDYTTLDPSLQVYNATFPNATATTPYPGASSVLVGRDFYALSANLPANTKFFWGVTDQILSANGTLNTTNLAQSQAQVAQLAQVFQGNRSNILNGQTLEFLEIGNEPNFGVGQYWNPYNYTRLWLEYAHAAQSVINLSEGGTTLIPGSYTGTSSTGVWTAYNTLDAGIFDDPKTSKVIQAWCEHKYSGASSSAPTPPIGTLMDKLNIRANYSSYQRDIAAVKKDGHKYIMGETNSYAGHGINGLSNTAEAAIWGVDYMLQGATNGIDRMYFHNGVGYYYDAFDPASNVRDGLNVSAPHIGPIYNAFVVVAEAIGNSGNAFVTELATTNNSISAYGIWDGGRLARAVVINQTPYTNSSQTRTSYGVNLLNFPGGYATVKTLDTPFTNSGHGITWANQTFDTLDGKPTGSVYEPALSGGYLEVPASSVALICFK